MSKNDHRERMERQEEWRENKCENSVRVNGCPDIAPHRTVPMPQSPGPYHSHELWCTSCVKETPGWSIRDGEVVLDTSENEFIPRDEITATEAKQNELELIE